MAESIPAAPLVSAQDEIQSKSRPEPLIFLTALVLGVLGDALLVVSPWGINVVLWLGALVLLVFAFVRQRQILITGGGRYLFIPALAFAALIAVRDSATLLLCNVLAILIVLAFAAAHTRTGRILRAGLLNYVVDLTAAGLFAVGGAFLLLVGLPFQRAAASDRLGKARAIGCGVVLAVPLLMVFGTLFSAADPIFERIARNLFAWDLRDLIGHLFWIALWFWLTGGMLYQLLLAREIRLPEEVRPGSFMLGLTEVGVVLGLLDALFLGFVVIQFRYFFGGAAVLDTTTGLTYAEYARRGFFELVTVAALVLPVLLAAHWILDKRNPRSGQVFNLLAGVLIALLLVIMVSALQRMRLYTDEFGLTELRLYTTAFMGWIALLLVWFLLTVMRGERDRFAFGTLAAGLFVLLVLNAINPDDLIARANTGRAIAPASNARREFDAGYVTILSADAIPALLEALPTLKPGDRCVISRQILVKWSTQATDWRTWNTSRAGAAQLVDANREILQAACANGP